MQFFPLCSLSLKPFLVAWQRGVPESVQLIAQVKHWLFYIACVAFRQKKKKKIEVCNLLIWPPILLIAGTYIDKKCPFTGTVSIRGRILAGTCHSAKMIRTIIVRRNYLHFVKKYQRQESWHYDGFLFLHCILVNLFSFLRFGFSRYEKRHSNIPAHISPCFRVKEGDHVIIGQCR